jgi:hypothetical protein
MKRPCPWCNAKPVVYISAEYCSYQCEDAAHRAVQSVESGEMASAISPLLDEDEEPEPVKTNQLDFWEKFSQTVRVEKKVC